MIKKFQVKGITYTTNGKITVRYGTTKCYHNGEVFNAQGYILRASMGDGSMGLVVFTHEFNGDSELKKWLAVAEVYLLHVLTNVANEVKKEELSFFEQSCVDKGYTATDEE